MFIKEFLSMKIKIYLFLVLGLSLLFTGCRIDTEERPDFPSVESFSPGYAVPGDTVFVIGKSLTGSSISLDNGPVNIIANTDSLLSFVVTESMSNSLLTVTYPDGDAFTFSFNIILNYMIQASDIEEGGWLNDMELDGTPLQAGELLRGPRQLLISDFDGGGIRFAEATSVIDQTQFAGLAAQGGDLIIGTNTFGATPSPVGGNNFGIDTPPTSIASGTFGFAGELLNRSELQNDRETSWPMNFIEYPASPIEDVSSNSDLENVFVNFLLFKNGNPKGVVDLNLTNDNFALGDRFRNRIADAQVGLDDWEWVSLPIGEISDGFGFGSRLNPDAYRTINILLFGFIHSDKANDEPIDAEGNATFLIDHIILTQGAPYYGHIR